MADVTALYQQAQALLQAGERVISTDEITGIQALERKHPTIPMAPGRVERREFEYTRHGTVTLIANFDVAQGCVVAPSMGPTRNEEDFVSHIARTVASEKATRWHFVADNLNTHQSESLVRFVAKHEGIEDDLGQKGWFSILVRKLLKRASFTSVEDLQAKVLAFIDYFNATMAKPFKWTYGRQPLRA